MTDISPIILIRPEQPAFYDAIAHVHLAAFGQEAEAELVEELRGLAGYSPRFSLVALYNGQVAGHILLTPITIRGAAALKVLALAPLAVLPDYQGQQVGSALVYESIEAARRAEIDALFVLGDPSVYGLFGFIPASQKGIQNPFGVDAEYMVLELNSGALDGIQGSAEYPAPFQRV